MIGGVCLKIVNLTNYIDFADRICKQFTDLNDTFGSISVIALYDEAKQVIAACVRYGLDIVSVEIDNAEYGDYCDEYIVTVDQEGLWCEPFKRNGTYISDASNITYIFDNCNSKVIGHCESDDIYEVCTDGYNEENIDTNIICGNDEYDEDLKCLCEHNELYSVSLTVNASGTYENYSYSTSDKSSVNTMLDKIKNICM